MAEVRVKVLGVCGVFVIDWSSGSWKKTPRGTFGNDKNKGKFTDVKAYAQRELNGS